MQSFKGLFCGLGVASLLCSCAGINVEHPEVDQIKTVAIVGATANVKFGDIDGKEKKESSGMKLLSAMVNSALPEATAEQVAIVTYGATALTNTFNSLNGWKAVPIDVVVENQAYQDLFKPKSENAVINKLEGLQQILGKASWVVPTGMYPVPYDAVVPQSTTYVNGEKIEAETLRRLASLCQALNVDAVAVVQYYFAYDRGLLSGMNGTGLFSNVRGYSTPMVGMNVAMIDKNGKVILSTDRGWGKFKADDTVPMMYHNEVDLKDGKGKCVDGYNKTIDKALASFKEKAAQKLSVK
ncbi:MAG: hypothetical protein M0P13_03020 [Fibrobacteraceae bacterium]|nr:hypothetical protein [Fibrobacteraceae bacterium]